MLSRRRDLLVVLPLLLPGTLLARQERPAQTAWALESRVAGVYDSNMDRVPEGPSTVGGVAAVAVYLQTRTDRTRWLLELETAAHQYQRAERWNRISHRGRSALRHAVGGGWLIEGVAEVAIRGSSEDRGLGNQFMTEARLIREVASATDLRLYGAGRIRQFAADPTQNARNWFAGAEIQQQLGGAWEMEAGFRYESNDAESERRRYRRQTWHAGVSLPVLGGNAEMEVKYRARRYTDRFVEVVVADEDEPVEVLRQDRRWIPSVSWRRPLWRGFALALRYEYETRDSNDPDRRYRGHEAGLALIHRW